MSFEDTHVVVLSSATINNVSIAHIQQAIYCCCYISTGSWMRDAGRGMKGLSLCLV